VNNPPKPPEEIPTRRFVATGEVAVAAISAAVALCRHAMAATDSGSRCRVEHDEPTGVHVTLWPFSGRCWSAPMSSCPSHAWAELVQR
jgi:hypothetical protein